MHFLIQQRRQFFQFSFFNSFAQYKKFVASDAEQRVSFEHFFQAFSHPNQKFIAFPVALPVVYPFQSHHVTIQHTDVYAGPHRPDIFVHGMAVSDSGELVLKTQLFQAAHMISPMQYRNDEMPENPQQCRNMFQKLLRRVIHSIKPDNFSFPDKRTDYKRMNILRH